MGLRAHRRSAIYTWTASEARFSTTNMCVGSKWVARLMQASGLAG
jgi:hypothetical protein